MCSAGRIPKYCMPLKSFFSVMNVRATEIWCSGQRRIPFLRVAVVSSNACDDTGGCDILPELTLFSMNP